MDNNFDRTKGNQDGGPEIIKNKTTNNVDDASKDKPTKDASKVELANGEAENVPVKNPAKEPEVKTGQSSIKKPKNKSETEPEDNSKETQGNSEENPKVNPIETKVNSEGTNENPEQKTDDNLAKNSEEISKDNLKVSS